MSEGGGYFMFDIYFQNQIRTFMYAGIEETLKRRETWHLCALALSVYTEVLGGLVTGRLRVKGSEKDNYEAFLKYLGEPYVRLDKEMKLHKMQLYHVFRSKLVHEFSPLPSYAIFGKSPDIKHPGLQFSFGDSLPIDFPRTEAIHYPAQNHLNIFLADYFEDFKHGVDRYYSDLKAELKNEAGPGQRPLNDNFYEATVLRT
jgi:hypothetical protein